MNSDVGVKETVDAVNVQAVSWANSQESDGKGDADAAEQEVCSVWSHARKAQDCRLENEEEEDYSTLEGSSMDIKVASYGEDNLDSWTNVQRLSGQCSNNSNFVVALAVGQFVL